MKKTEVDVPEEMTISPFVLEIISAGFANTATMSNNLIDSLMSQLATLKAETKAIRDGVESLFEGPYMPTPEAVRRALYPRAELVDTYREGVR